jgi:hypothetical protein
VQRYPLLVDCIKTVGFDRINLVCAAVSLH